MNDIARDALGRRPSRRQALVAAGCVLLASASLGTAASAAVGNQESWRFCSNCFSMFWDGSGNKGTCPAGGAHIAQGFTFTPHYDDAAPETGTTQYGWRFCSKCSAMFYNGGPRGKCPSGGAHVAQGFNFGLNHAGSAPASQTEWRFCQQCSALFYNGSSSKGRCTIGGGHVAQGFVFNVPFHGVDAAAAPAALPEFLTFDDNSITFKGGLAADAFSHVKLHQDGRVEFQSHFHDSGATDYAYSITWAIAASDGTIFRLHHRGRISGHILGTGQSDRNSNFDQTLTNDAVARHWAALARGNVGRVSAHAATTFGGLLDTAKTALQDAQEAAGAVFVVQGEAVQIVEIFAD